MKKILSILFLLVLPFLLTCCGEQQPEQTPEPLEQQGVIQIQSHFDFIDINFEKFLKGATDVVKAKCIGETEGKYDSYFEFEVTERFSGEDVEKNILVEMYGPETVDYVGEDGTVQQAVYTVNYQSEKQKYEIGKEYYLILNRQISVYNDLEYYSDMLLYAPEGDLSKSTLFGEKLAEKSELKKGFSEKKLVKHIKEVLATDTENKLYEGQKYIESTDMNTIIDGSDHVLKVEILESTEVKKYLNKSSERFKCKIISTLKGDKEENTEIEIAFFADTVSVGEQYIVALADYGDSKIAQFSSKNSFFNLEDEQKIIEYIDK